MIRAYRGVVPKIAASAYIDQSAQVIGDVVVGERASIWPNVTARGDVNSIRIGDETNIQDNSVLHCDAGDFPLNIGSCVTVGHLRYGGSHLPRSSSNQCLIGSPYPLLGGSRGCPLSTWQTPIKRTLRHLSIRESTVYFGG